MVKMNEYTKDFVEFGWINKVTKEQRKRIRTAYTHYSKAWDSIVRQLDNSDYKKVLYTIANSRIAVLPAKEMDRTIKNLACCDDDAILVDYAVLACHPCREPSETVDKCLLKQYLERHNYPKLTEDEIRDEDKENYKHCAYCMSR
jgi:hypothetical protein